MDHDDDGETSYNTFVDDVAFEPTYSQALLTAAGRNVATQALQFQTVFLLIHSTVHAIVDDTFSFLQMYHKYIGFREFAKYGE